MTRPSPATPPRGDARWIALGLLRAVLRRKRPLDQALEESPELARLEPRDRAFARNLVATSLRRLNHADAILAQFLDKPLPDPQGFARDLLRLGTVQLVFLGSAPHAAVNSAVDLAAPAGVAHLKGLLNAVLRRIATEGAALAAAQDAERLLLPDWLWQSWNAAYGEAAARRSAAMLLLPPPLDLSVKSDAAGWAERLGADLLPTGTVRLAESLRVSELPGFSDGAWWVQDAAAALPARLLGDVRGLAVADIAAAPGGKTAQLAAAGADVTAIDRSAPRLQRVEQNLARLGLAAHIVAADATALGDEYRGRFDAVLLDAPCSATGTARRHPDILHLKQPADVAKLAELQDRLLAAALALVKPGGLLVYCTCSLEPAEGPERIAGLLGGGAELRRLPIEAAEIGGLGECVTQEGDLRTLPGQLAERGGLDGFYAARLRVGDGKG
jgi:16S rRNA (cytosine967-C5)-methyltransferase